MSGHMGVVRRTIENLKVVEVDVARNLLLIRGAVPGAEGGRVVVRLSVKAQRQAGRKTIAPTKQAPVNKTPNPAKAGKK
jgi:ribosomal protein L3